MDRPVASTEIKYVTQKFTANKSPGSDGFADEFYHTFREDLTPILLKLLQKLHRKEHF